MTSRPSFLVTQAGRFMVLGSMSLMAGLGGLRAAETASPLLPDLTFEELANITITTASKHGEPLFRSAAAVSVIEANDIRRLGVTNVMDLLRFSPGVQVAQISPAAWGIGVRGFNSQDSRKLLVMRDGRSVYDTLFSGVWWDVQDPSLDDIARIEVVRGPGGALWGANAVNGVINIISKTARETPGARISATWQDDGSSLVSLREGWAAGRDTFARVTVQHRNADDVPLLAGGEGRNGHRLLTGSFRVDHGTPGENGFTLFGNFHQGRTRQALRLPVLTAPYSQLFENDIDVAGASLHGRWDRTDPAYGTFTVQAYGDYFERGPVSLDQKNLTLDFDFQHQPPPIGRQTLIWGAGYRQISDELGSGSGTSSFDPPERTRKLFSAFIQDEITLLPDRLSWIIGARIEHNDISGWEVQPSTRLLFTPRRDQTYWLSISRAVRTPDRTSDFMLRLGVLPPATTAALPTELLYEGNRWLKAEELLACEGGMRFAFAQHFRFDVALYVNDYDSLVNFAPGALVPATNPDRNIRYIEASNQAYGRTWGGEASFTWQVRENWRLTTGYSSLHMDLQGPGLPFLDNSSGQNPTTMFTLHSALDLGERWNLDLMARHMGSLPSWGVKAYWEMDLQLGWRPLPGLQLALIGRNLLHREHFEAPSGRTGTPSAMVPRTIGVQLNHEF